MVAPQINGVNNADASNWKIVKSKRHLREERKSNYNLNSPPLQSASSLGSKTYKNKSPSIKTTKSTDSSQSSQGHSEGWWSQNHKSPKSNTGKCEDDMSTVSSSSHEGFFSSDGSDTEEEKNTSIKSIQNNKDISTSQNNNDSKDYDEDEELNKIIAKIEKEHISTMYDKHMYNQKDNKKATRELCPYIKIKREEDHGIEMA